MEIERLEREREKEKEREREKEGGSTVKLRKAILCDLGEARVNLRRDSDDACGR